MAERLPLGLGVSGGAKIKVKGTRTHTIRTDEQRDLGGAVLIPRPDSHGHLPLPHHEGTAAFVTPSLLEPQSTPAVSPFKQSNELKSSQRTKDQSFKAMVYMGLLALQFGVQPILVKRFTPKRICKSSVVLAQEALKFMIASVVYFAGTDKEHRRNDLDDWSIQKWLVLAGVPAALYVVQNMASLLAYQNLEALTFNVLNQTKILSAAVCCYLVMGKKQSRMQSLSLILLLASALVIEKIVSVSSILSLTSGGGLFSSATSAIAALRSFEVGRRVTHGVLPVLLASFISGLAGALTQKILQGATTNAADKQKKPRNTYLFSMEMNAASAIFLLASLLVSADGKRIAESGLFHQFTTGTWIPIVTNSIGGILVGLVTKHAGTVRKGFALIFGILISGLVQVGSGGITIAQVVGGVLASLSLWLHTTHPYVQKQ